MPMTIYAEGNTIRNALAAVRKKLKLKLAQSQEHHRVTVGEQDHLCQLSSGHVVHVRVHNERGRRVTVRIEENTHAESKTGSSE